MVPELAPAIATEADSLRGAYVTVAQAEAGMIAALAGSIVNVDTGDHPDPVAPVATPAIPPADPAASAAAAPPGGTS